jgi:hypothetical protein
VATCSADSQLTGCPAQLAAAGLRFASRQLQSAYSRRLFLAGETKRENLVATRRLKTPTVLLACLAAVQAGCTSRSNNADGAKGGQSEQAAKREQTSGNLPSRGALSGGDDQARDDRDSPLPSPAAPSKAQSPGAKLYDTQADGNQQIAVALKLAKGTNKRVLLKFGANWCGWCHKLSKCFKADPAIAAMLEQHYVLVLIDVDATEGQERHNADVLERYGNPTKLGLPVLVVLDADGKQLTTQDTGELEEGDHHDPEKVLAFLENFCSRLK